MRRRCLSRAGGLQPQRCVQWLSPTLRPTSRSADRTRRVDVVRDASVTVRCLGTRNAGPAGYNERLLAMIWFDLLPRDDLTADTAEIAQRHVAARAA
jgi:hypothetical protein